MKIITILISTFLTWAAFDLNLFRKRRTLSASNVIEVSLSESAEELFHKKEVHRHNLDVMPSWHRGSKKLVRSKCNYFSTKSRDVRYSDQRKIRRRINNM